MKEVVILAEKQWHGVARSEFEWAPVIDYSKCTDCGLCLLSCGNAVFGWSKSKEKFIVANGGNCVVGCTTCGKVCPENAISFPAEPTKFVKAAVVKYKIFPAVKKELQARLEKFPDHVVNSDKKADGING
jgi:NAD-dependent dihydropyrimidine dehydrogenase PreA subunit